MEITRLKGTSAGWLPPGIRKEKRRTAANKMMMYIMLLRFQLDFIKRPRLSIYYNYTIKNINK
jgi:hypothetical protein